MEDVKLKQKFNELQKYLPFLEKVIQNLRNSRRDDADTYRNKHLQRLQMLHDLLTNKGKMLKLDALLKCEALMIKLYNKTEQTSSFQDGLSEKILLDEMDKEKSINLSTDSNDSIEKMRPAVPESPPPDDDNDDCVIVPVEIPTERCITPKKEKSYRNYNNSSKYDSRSHREKYDKNYSPRPEHRNNYEHKSYHELKNKADYSTRYDREKYRYERPKHDRERMNREKLDRERNDHGRLEHKTVDRERIDRDRIDRERNDCERNERERNDRERNNREWKSRDKHDGQQTNNIGYDRSTHYRNLRECERNLERSESRDVDDRNRGVFSRLGQKYLTDKNQSINSNTTEVTFKRIVTQEVTVTSCSTHHSPKISGRLKSPPFPDDDVLNKSIPHKSEYNSATAYGIGERRLVEREYIAKEEPPKQYSSFDEVRKKFALLAKCSDTKPFNNDCIEKNTQNFPSSKSLGDRFNYNVESNQGKVNRLDITKDPRLKKENYVSKEPTVKCDGYLPSSGNVLPSINRLDPRLRHNSSLTPGTSNLHSQYNETNLPINIENRTVQTDYSANKAVNVNFSSNLKSTENYFASHPKDVAQISPNSSHAHKFGFDELWDRNIHSTHSFNSRSIQIPSSHSDRKHSPKRGHNWDARDNSRPVQSSIPSNINLKPNYSSRSYSSDRNRNGEDKNCHWKTRNDFGNYEHSITNTYKPNDDTEENWDMPEQSSRTKSFGNLKKEHSQLHSVHTISSSEENWDDDDTTTTQCLSSYDLNMKRILAAEKEEASTGTQTGNSSNNIRHVKDYNSVEYSNEIEDEIESMSGPSKFNAVLNDNFERTHYLESKKQKQKSELECSPTFAEYKLRKARIEEAKRKALEQAYTNNQATVKSPTEKKQADIKVNTTKEIAKNEEEKKLETKQQDFSKSKSDTTVKKGSSKEKTNKNTEQLQTKCKSDVVIKNDTKTSIVKTANVENMPKITKEDIDKLPSFSSSSIPKRRNSMSENESKPLIEKDKLKFANTILYEDIQCGGLNLNNSKIISIKLTNRNTESLANIFKKTDDNCTVSTQNIISGKRRTRTTVNFNEVKQSQTVFKHKRSSLGENHKQSQKPEKQMDGNENLESNPQIDEKICSSTKSSETTQENGSQEVLEGFVKDILNPNANTEYIFGLLKQILPEEKLNQVKTIIESAQTNNRSDDTSNTNADQVKDKNLQNDCEDISKNLVGQELIESAAQKKRMRKRNELDRLNDDIRDMFISQGVVTATGRRMCKLASESSPTTENELIKTPSESEKYAKVLKQQCTIKLQKLKVSKETSPSPSNSSKSSKKKIISKPLKKGKKAKTEETVEIIPIELSPKQRTVKKVQEEELEPNTSKDQCNENIEEENIVVKRSKAKFSRKIILKMDGIRNTDIKWHFLSKYADKCIVCKTKISFLPSHYHWHHAESYISRLAPTVLKKLKNGTLGVVEFCKSKNGNHSVLFHRCPICLQYAWRTLTDWIEHISIHTSEYRFSCSYCRKGFPKKGVIENHIEKHCPKGTVIRNGVASRNEKILRGYVCHLCNFVQVKPHLLIRHYIEQHEIEKKVSETLGFEVSLMDWSKMKEVTEKRGVILEKKAKQQKFSFIFDEAEETNDNEDFENDEVDERNARELQSADINTDAENDDNTQNKLKKGTKELLHIAVTPFLIEKKEQLIENESSNDTNVNDESKNTNTVNNVLKHRKIDPNTSNVFLPTPRDTESPTTVFKQKLLTIQQESNQDSSASNKNQSLESMAERLSQRLKRLEKEQKCTENENLLTASDEKAISSKSSEMASEEHSKSGSDLCDKEVDEDCWEDIESPESDNQLKKIEKSGEKGKMKSNKKLHKFYASNANKAKKIKSSYLTGKKTLANVSNKEQIDKNECDIVFQPLIFKLDDLNSPSEDSNDDRKITSSSAEILKNPELPAKKNEVKSKHAQKRANEKEIDQTKGVVNRIWNVGFSKNDREKFKFYCLSKSCTFLYSNEAVGLETHCLIEHSNTDWDGFCRVCDKIVDDGNMLSIYHEIQHMINMHVKQQPIDESIQLSNFEVNDEISRPRLKIRRLSGDCLSMSPQTTIDQSSCDIEGEILPSLPPSITCTTEPEAMFSNSSNDYNINPAVCGLQITSVRSLNNCLASDSFYPKISNVCSLNPASSVIPESNNNSTKERQNNESPEPIIVGETIPVAQTTAGNFLITQTVSTLYRDNGEITGTPNTDIHIAVTNSSTSTTNSPAKPNVATLLTTGTSNSLVSKPSNSNMASNDYTRGCNPNRAPYVCMAKNCKFSTRVAVSMLDHLNFHEVRCFVTQRDFLRCNYCEYEANDKKILIQHIDEQHLQTFKQINPTNLPQTTAAVPKNKINQKTKQTQPKSSYYKLKKLKEAIKSKVSFTGETDEDLYNCIFENCNENLNETTFTAHVEKHATELNNPLYKCNYCDLKYKLANGLKNHLKIHRQHRYFCYLCTKTTSTTVLMMKHFTDEHWHISKINLGKLYEPEPKDVGIFANAIFVAHGSSLIGEDVQKFQQKLIIEMKTKNKTSSKFVYHYSDAHKLPLQPIFQNEIHCANCPYKTKVRTNMLRHLSLHKSGLVIEPLCDGPLDPVNPMPCLNSTEKHFDKMTNLASSSLTTHQNAGSLLVETAGNFTEKTLKLKVNYEYVPINRVYTCGVSDCQYLTLSDDIFRSHVLTLHGDTQLYTCPFCQEEICKRGISMDRILHHLRFHGQLVYQCEECSYVHYVKHVVRRHIQEKHASCETVNLVTYDRESESGALMTLTLVSTKSRSVEECATKIAPKSTSIASTVNTNAIAKGQKRCNIRWKCDLCDHFTKTHNQIISHCNTMHGFRHRYQCSICSYGASKIEQVHDHMMNIHESQDGPVNVLFHREDEPETEMNVNIATTVAKPAVMNTKPLWQRDDPQRIRHIRGILMEDEEETEQHRKRLRLDDYIENEDDDVVTVN